MEMESPPPPDPTRTLHDQLLLVERARRGDPSAHRVLYETHVEKVYRLTYRLTGQAQLARELTQDAFVRAFAGIGGFRGDSAFASWLHAIAVSVTLNELRRRKRHRDREASLDEASMVAKTTPMSDPLLRKRLSEAIAALPEGCRTVFMMHDAEGFTHEEIATRLGITAGTSKAQLSRARAKLRVALAQFAREWER